MASRLPAYGSLSSRFFFNDTATPEIYTLSLHDALPISDAGEHSASAQTVALARQRRPVCVRQHLVDRKSTRLNSSHANISYAVFCLKKKKHHHKSNTLHTHRYQEKDSTIPVAGENLSAT